MCMHTCMSQGKRKTEARIGHNRNAEQIVGIHGETGKWKYGSEFWKLRLGGANNWELFSFGPFFHFVQQMTRNCCIQRKGVNHRKIVFPISSSVVFSFP